jgi:uncharacterized membrane protein YoaK (UPF0700 family)
MKVFLGRLVGCFIIFLALNVLATVHYVDLNSTNATPPYTDWTTAATNIQDAIDASTNGETVLVTNGLYASGGRAMEGGITNRVAVDSALTVQSVNGPWVTIVQGLNVTYGTKSVRCAWLTNNATLTGFTLEGGSTFNSGSLTTGCGGGVWCASSNSVVDNCVIVSNTAYQYGSGVYQGTYNNCLISSNNGWMSHGVSAVYNASLNSCTVVSNSYFNVNLSSTLTNCIVYYNNTSSPIPGSVAAYCCATPLPTGNGNFTNAPQLFADGVHLLGTSPCIGAGTNLVTGTDIFGNAWSNPPSVGCAEYNPAPILTQPSIILTGNPLGFAINVAAAGLTPVSVAWLKDGVALQDNGHFTSTQTTNLVVTGVSITDAGNYQLVASNTFGVTTSAVASLAIHCVDAAGANPAPPYLTWATAATNIQDAVNAASAGDIVLVTDGVYSASGKSEDGLITNRVALDKAIRVQSVNGPWLTTIEGAGATNGPAGVRCAWLTNNAVLAGFTLKWGATLTSGNSLNQESGGGVWCASSNSFVDNCVIVSNAAYYNGSGSYQGTLQNCLIRSNSAARNAAYGASLNSCTIVSNSNLGVSGGVITNCIVYYNPSGNCQNVSAAGYCCTTPALAGTGNFTSAPQLQADGVHLSSGSPCIGAGTNLVTGTDIFGLAWANPPSVGCAEYNPLPTVSPPQITLTGAPVGFKIGNVTVAGQPPLAFLWLEDGVPLQNNGHFSSTQTTNLVATGVRLADAGSYQLVVSNAYGSVTSAAVQVAVHAVDAAGVNPQPPFATWATAATNIQDAIEAASAGDIVLVTNGIYDAGGEAMAGGLTNRVALDKGLLVASVNGYAVTVIRGAWDPVSTNGPAAVRCAWLTNGAVLSGFTLQNGATWNTGDTTALQSGGGAWCASTNAQVCNCLLSNNFASYGGGGIGFGTLNNSLVVQNVATYGGGAYEATLNNCTVQDNYTTVAVSLRGGGTYGGFVQNSIVMNNYDGYPELIGTDNYAISGGATLHYSYCCSSSSLGLVPGGPGNIDVEPLFLDWYHISIYSPCRGAGSALYTSGADLDGEPWNNPPSIGCDEVVVANRVGPLTVAMVAFYTNVLVSSGTLSHYDFFSGTITGLATYLSWNFGDGPAITNADNIPIHYWTNAGDYSVVFTAYNIDNPSGVSTTQVIHVVPVNPLELQSPSIVSNSLLFQFTAQVGANYTVQYATNLTPPVTWLQLQSIHYSFGGVTQIQDSAPTNASRFYRVLAQ